MQKCPYCQGTKIIKKGTRTKKYETVQLYYCPRCEKKFTPGVTKGKTFPLKVILDAISLYNRFYPLEEAAGKVSEKYGLSVSPQTIANWLKDFAEYLPFLRMRDFISRKYDPRDILVESKMFHGQIYDFKYHRAKTDCILEDTFRHYLRHEVLEEFMLLNDSVTVATEVPVLMDEDDIRHYQNELGFEVPEAFARPGLAEQGQALITGHIDLLQIRNGAIHILDYKPSAKKAKPVDQLTLYALALARLTGLRLFHFKCGWFDEEDYFEFFPLHVVYKKKRKKRKK